MGAMKVRAILVSTVALAVVAICTFAFLGAAQTPSSDPDRDPFTNYKKEKPGTRRKITLADLPQPYATPSVDNGSEVITRPKDAWPQVPAGFKVQLYADGFENPRLMRTAPNGDIFLADSEAGEIKVLRGADANGKAIQVTTFASGLNKPFGIAFYPLGENPQWVYIGNTDAVVRIPYKSGDLQARGKPEHVADLAGGGRLRGGGHWTRDVAFSNDGKKLFASVGSHSNVSDPDTTPAEHLRANVLEFNPDGSGMRVYASGIRNAVGIALHPRSGQLWVSVNERDGLGDNLVPDYISHVEDGQFFGWPWYYMGGNQDPRHKGKHPELKNKVTTPDVLLQPHFASLQMTFYEGTQFPTEYRGHAFAAEHGSWNRSTIAGYEVIRVPIDQNGKASGEFEDFMTGFVTPEGKVWGRPVGVTVAKDGALLVSDDGSNSIWRVTWVGK